MAFVLMLYSIAKKYSMNPIVFYEKYKKGWKNIVGTKINSYLGIADNDLGYLRLMLDIAVMNNYFNPITIQSAQVAEKSLKAIAEKNLINSEEIYELLRTRNLRKIAQALSLVEGIPKIDLFKCKFVGDFYFDAQYPGDDFIIVDHSTALYCIECAEEINQIAHKVFDAGDKKGK